MADLSEGTGDKSVLVTHRFLPWNPWHSQAETNVTGGCDADAAEPQSKTTAATVNVVAYFTLTYQPSCGSFHRGGVGRGCGVTRGRGVELGLGVGVGVGVTFAPDCTSNDPMSM